MGLSTPASPPDRFAPDLLDRLPLGISVYRLDDPGDPASFRLVYANPASGEITGLDIDREVGRRLVEIAPDVAETGLLDRYAEVVRAGRDADIGLVTYGDDRIAERTFQIEAVPLGERSVGVVFEDVGDRTELQALREARARLVREEARYRSLVEATAAIVWTTSPEGRLRRGPAGVARRDGPDDRGADGGGVGRRRPPRRPDRDGGRVGRRACRGGPLRDRAPAPPGGRVVPPDARPVRPRPRRGRGDRRVGRGPHRRRGRAGGGGQAGGQPGPVPDPLRRARRCRARVPAHARRAGDVRRLQPDGPRPLRVHGRRAPVDDRPRPPRARARGPGGRARRAPPDAAVDVRVDARDEGGPPRPGWRPRPSSPSSTGACA